MANLPIPARDDLEEFEEFFGDMESLAGYLPTAYLLLGHQPVFLRAMTHMSRALQQMDSVDRGLKVLMSHLSSSVVGCRFCEAHTAKTADNIGVLGEKIHGVWEFESSPLFSDAERAALRLARDMVQRPSAVEATHFEDLRTHFDDGQITEMVITVSMFGFWNRWNDTMATDLETPVHQFASALLADRGWEGSRHLHDADTTAP